MANALFADGAGAVLLARRGGGPQVIATRTLLVPDGLAGC